MRSTERPSAKGSAPGGTHSQDGQRGGPTTLGNRALDRGGGAQVPQDSNQSRGGPGVAPQPVTALYGPPEDGTRPGTQRAYEDAQGAQAVGAREQDAPPTATPHL